MQIKPFTRFWPAEGYHQDYAELNSVKYRYYRWACGRDRRLDQVWGSQARTPGGLGVGSTDHNSRRLSVEFVEALRLLVFFWWWGRVSAPPTESPT